jgi:hypothetical protein
MAITTWAATTGDWNDSKFDRGWNGPAISPAKGDLTLSGSAPSLQTGFFISPDVLNLELIQSYEWNQLTESWEAGIGNWESGPLPHVAVSDPRNPANADLTLTGGSAPNVGIEYKFPIAVGELPITTTAPSVGEALHITPGVGNIEFIQSYEWDQMSAAWIETSYSWETGPSPSMAIGTGISPDNADVTLSGGSAPSLTFEFNIIPDNADLTITGTAPVDNFGKSFDVANADLEIVQSYNWNTYGDTWANASTDWETAGSPFVPTAVEEGKNQPDNADLTLTGQVPDWRLAQLWYVPTQDLTLSTTAPDAPTGPSIEIGTGELTILKSYNWDTYGGLWNDASSNWDDVAFSPSASETSHGHVPEADLTLTGQVPVASESEHHLIPVAAESTLTGFIPAIGGNHFRSPAKGDLTGLSSATWETYGGDWASASDAWGIGTLSPTPGITYTFPIDDGQLALTPYDLQWPLVSDPYYKPQVIMS